MVICVGENPESVISMMFELLLAAEPCKVVVEGSCVAFVLHPASIKTATRMPSSHILFIFVLSVSVI